VSEAAFPVLGAAFVVLVVLPLSAALTKALLVFLEREQRGGRLGGLGLRYVLLTASSVLPVAWFLSAGIHQAESGRSALACLLAHEEPVWCAEPAVFALLLAGASFIAWRSAFEGAGPVPLSWSPRAEVLSQRLARLIDAAPSLAPLRGRVVVTEERGFTLGTRGLVRPLVFVGTELAAKLTDDMLESALGHEQEHVRSRDPLRYLLLQLALGINPFGRFLLAPHAARWRAAREAHCDREAVLHGASPLPLADAILRAARPTSREAAPLGAEETSVLSLRVRLLVAFSERAPVRCRHEHPSALPLALALVVAALLLPHRTGTAVLDLVHIGAEQALGFALGPRS
jgi:Zn-dependent protease with chaperone function